MRPNSEPIRAQGLRIVVSKNLFSEELIKDFFYLFRPKNGGGGGTAPLALPPAGGPVFNLLRIFLFISPKKWRGGTAPLAPPPIGGPVF